MEGHPALWDAPPPIALILGIGVSCDEDLTKKGVEVTSISLNRHDNE